MTTTTSKPRPCQAKDPDTCAYHNKSGVVPTALDAVVDCTIAAQRMRSSKRELDSVKNLAEVADAKRIIAYDQLVYDSTLVGLKELEDKIGDPYEGNDLSLAEELELRERVRKAVRFRDITLSRSPIHVESEEIFRDTVKDSVFSHKVDSDGDYVELVEGLRFVKPGELVAIKTVHGSYVYDSAGTGLTVRQPSLITRLLTNKPSFVQDVFASNPRNAYVALRNFTNLLPVKDIAEIHVLPAGSKFDSKDLSNSSTRSINPINNNAYGRFAVRGDGFYLEAEGDVTGRREVTVGPKDSQVGNFSLMEDMDVEFSKIS